MNNIVIKSTGVTKSALIKLLTLPPESKDLEVVMVYPTGSSSKFETNTDKFIELAKIDEIIFHTITKTEEVAIPQQANDV